MLQIVSIPAVRRSLFAVMGLGLGLLLWGGHGKAAAAPNAADSSVAEIPSPESLRQLPLREHPRLYASKERFRALKEQITGDEQARRWYEQLKRRADRYVADTTRPRHVLPDGKRLLSISKRVLHRVRTLALVYQIEGDRQYAERAWQELEAAAAFPDWNPAHFLDVAEMTQGFAIGYDWLHDVWTDRQHRILREAMTEKGLRVALRAYREGDYWTRMEHIYNWGQVTNGGIGLGALAVLEEQPKLASRVLYEALRRLPASMSHYAPDGGWIEGVGYWGYATQYTSMMLDALGQGFGKDFGLSQMPGFAKTGYFPIYMTGPSGGSFNHSDSHVQDVGGPQLFWMAQRFDQPAYAGYWKKHAASGVLNLIWYTPEVAEMAAASPDLPLDRYFEASHVALFRSAWSDSDALFVGFKGGNTDASHAHLDVGSFLLEANGVRWAVDLGPDDYNVPGYFAMDTQRWTYYRTRAEGQNTLVIGPGETPDQDILAVSEIIRFRSQPERSFAIADLTPAYADHVRSAKRGVALLNGRRQVLVQDEVRAGDPVDAWWFMHTRSDVEIGDDASTAVLRQDGKRLWAKLLTPAAARFTVRDAQPLPASPDPDEQAENEGVRKLAIELDGVKDTRLAVLLVPLGEGPSPPKTLPEVQALAAW